jgi:DNA-binding XRE family transcriptional regulator
MAFAKLITKERIEEKVLRIPEAGCWVWMGSTQVRGYGEISSNNRKLLAHRASYEAFVGKIPKGIYVCHACDNVSCVNPNHLFLGTQKQNLQDMANKGRSTRGVKNPMAKLDNYAVKEIREGIKTGHTDSNLAKAWMVCRQTINKIRNGKVWNHV